MKPVLDALPPERTLAHLHLGHRGAERADEGRPLRRHLPHHARASYWQIWGFVAPGLYPQRAEVRLRPSCSLGTLAFLIGAAFCYLVVLPTMFKFLLTSGDTAPHQGPGGRGRGRWRSRRFASPARGTSDRAANLADGEAQRLTAMGDGRRLGAGPVRRRHGGAAGAPRRRGPAAGRHPGRARAGRGAGAAAVAREADGGGGRLRSHGSAGEGVRGAGRSRPALLAGAAAQPGAPGVARAVEAAEDARRRSGLAGRGGLDPAACSR